MIKLIATDMDGTFLDEKKQFDPSFVELFFKLKELGITFVVASGQQYYKLFQRFVPMSTEMYFIAENGTFIAKGGQMLSVNAMKREDVFAAMEAINETGRLVCMLSGTKGTYIENKHLQYKFEVEKYYLQYQFVESFKDVEDDFIKIAVYDPDYNIQEFEAELKEKMPPNVRLVTSGNEWNDVINNDVNKGIAYKQIQQYHGVTSEECAAFGDQMNDYELLKSCKYGFAMSNAVDGVKSVAFDVIKSNEEQGVLEVLKDIIKNKGEVIKSNNYK